MPRALCSVVSFYLVNSGNLYQENNLKRKSCGKEFALVLIISNELNLRAPQIMNTGEQTRTLAWTHPLVESLLLLK